MQATEKLDKPGYTRVVVHGVVRADGRPRYHITGNYRSETENLCHCASGQCCWGVDKMFSADNCDNNEDKKEENPGTILEPGKKVRKILKSF